MESKACTNVQPLWSEENRKKFTAHGKLPDGSPLLEL